MASNETHALILNLRQVLNATDKITDPDLKNEMLRIALRRVIFMLPAEERERLLKEIQVQEEKNE